MPKEKEKKKTAVTTSLKIIEKKKRHFSFLSNFWGIFVGFVGSEIHHVLEHYALFSWSLTCGHSMRLLCDDHEEDGNDEF